MKTYKIELNTKGINDLDLEGLEFEGNTAKVTTEEAQSFLLRNNVQYALVGRQIRHAVTRESYGFLKDVV